MNTKGQLIIGGAMAAVVFVVIGILALVNGCAGGAAPVVKTIVGDLVSVCNALDTQPEPAVVVITCDVIDEAGTVVSTFMVKKPAPEARAFLAAHAKPAGGR